MVTSILCRSVTATQRFVSLNSSKATVSSLFESTMVVHAIKLFYIPLYPTKTILLSA